MLLHTPGRSPVPIMDYNAVSDVTSAKLLCAWLLKGDAFGEIPLRKTQKGNIVLNCRGVMVVSVSHFFGEEKQRFQEEMTIEGEGTYCVTEDPDSNIPPPLSGDLFPAQASRIYQPTSTHGPARLAAHPYSRPKPHRHMVPSDRTYLQPGGSGGKSGMPYDDGEVDNQKGTVLTVSSEERKILTNPNGFLFEPTTVSDPGRELNQELTDEDILSGAGAYFLCKKRESELKGAVQYHVRERRGKKKRMEFAAEIGVRTSAKAGGDRDGRGGTGEIEGEQRKGKGKERKDGGKGSDAIKPKKKNVKKEKEGEGEGECGASKLGCSIAEIKSLAWTSAFAKNELLLQGFYFHIKTSKRVFIILRIIDGTWLVTETDNPYHDPRCTPPQPGHRSSNYGRYQRLDHLLRYRYPKDDREGRRILLLAQRSGLHCSQKSSCFSSEQLYSPMDVHLNRTGRRTSPRRFLIMGLRQRWGAVPCS